MCADGAKNKAASCYIRLSVTTLIHPLHLKPRNAIKTVVKAHFHL